MRVNIGGRQPCHRAVVTRPAPDGQASAGADLAHRSAWVRPHFQALLDQEWGAGHHRFARGGCSIASHWRSYQGRI